MDMEKIAHWAFVACVIIAIIMGLVVGYMYYNSDAAAKYNFQYNTGDLAKTNAYVILVLLILGIIVGLTNVTAKEVTPFLIAAIALVVASGAHVWGPLGVINEVLADWATFILNYLVAFVAPAAVLIAIKAVFAVEKAKA
jgi:hypothetical protein